MSLTAAAWAALAGLLVLRSFGRSVWAVGFYMLTFFAAPHLWWWGKHLPTQRYALISGFVLLLSVLLAAATSPSAERRSLAFVSKVVFAFVINATFVHLFLASNSAISIDNYIEVLKFSLLFFLILSAIQHKNDLRVVLMIIALGGAYIGYEVTINERGHFSGSRLEGVGAPGADTANDLANLLLVILPLIGSLFISGTRRQKGIAIIAAPLVLNVLLMCNSRGAFLGLIGAGLTFFVVARGPSRKKAIRALVLGSVALYLLLGNPKILDRFLTTFVGSEERDNSAASRMVFWRAGLLMVRDHPFGAGGGAFKYVHAEYYLALAGSDEPPRSLHNSYLEQATSWGVQGLFLKLLALGGAIGAAYRTSRRCSLAGHTDDALVGAAFLASSGGLLIAGFFGSFFGNEWTYWLTALLVSYARLYRPELKSIAAARQEPMATVA